MISQWTHIETPYNYSYTSLDSGHCSKCRCPITLRCATQSRATVLQIRGVTICQALLQWLFAALDAVIVTVTEFKSQATEAVILTFNWRQCRHQGKRKYHAELQQSDHCQIRSSHGQHRQNYICMSPQCRNNLKILTSIRSRLFIVDQLKRDRLYIVYIFRCLGQYLYKALILL